MPRLPATLSATLAALALAACGDARISVTPKAEVRAAVETRPAAWAAGERTLSTTAGQLALTLHRNADPDRPLIVYCGGTAFTVPAFGDAVIDKLSPFGDVLVWDYPGRGRSGGTPGLRQARAMTGVLLENRDRLARRGQPVIYWGHSLGGFVCADMVADDPRATGLVLESTAISADAVVAELDSGRLSAMLKAQLPPEIAAFSIPERIAGRDVEVLVIGGARDRVLPVPLQRDLAAAIPGAAYAEYPEANHFDAGFQPGFADDVNAFLQRAQNRR